MVTSAASTVDQYLAELPAERRDVISAVRKVVLAKLPRGYVETMNWGGICYEIPLSTYPVTYNGQPLAYAGLAAQKHFFGLYLMCVYGDNKKSAKLRAAFAKSGKKLDMGKSCIRFRHLEDLPLDIVGEMIASTTPQQFIEIYEKSRRTKQAKPGGQPAETKKTSPAYRRSSAHRSGRASSTAARPKKSRKS